MHDSSAVIAVLLALEVCAAPAAAQTAPATAPASQPTASAPAVRTNPYTDVAFGFELQIPAGWEYDRTRFQQYKDSIGLLRGRAPDGRQALQIMIFRIQPRERPGADGEPARLVVPGFEDWVVDFWKGMAELTGSRQVTWGTLELPPRAAAVLTYESSVVGTRTWTHCVCVPFDPGTVWVLVLSGTAAGAPDEQALRQLLEQLARSLKVHYDPAAAEELGAALTRGQALRVRLRKLAPQVQLDESEHWYDITLAGRPLGYLRRRIAREEHLFTAPDAKFRDARPGLRVRERAWRFESDGSARFARLDLFSSFDGQDELIEHEQLVLPPGGQPEPPPLRKTDQVLRKEDVLFSSFTTSLDRTLPDPAKPVAVGPAYLDLAWVRVLPGLLLGAKPEPHAFAVYNLETRALVTETITPLGERRLEGQDGPLHAFEVREGYVDAPSQYYVDARGTLVRLVAGELVMQRVTRADAERKYGERRDAARRQFDITED